MKRILYNALIINEGEKYKGYIEIEDDLIKNTGKGEVPSETLDLYASGERENLEEKWILPGIIDDQVHFREPGLTHKADIESESKAAALGGITSFMDMPNTSPRTVTIPDWEDKMRRGKEKSSVNYSFFIGATNDNIDEIKRIDNRLVPGIKVFLGASTGNMLVDSEETLDKIFSLPHIIAVHSEEESIINANKKKVYREVQNRRSSRRAASSDSKQGGMCGIYRKSDGTRKKAWHQPPCFPYFHCRRESDVRTLSLQQ